MTSTVSDQGVVRSFRARLSVFLRAFPFAAIAATALFVFAAYLHDRTCDGFQFPVLRVSEVLGVEYRHETGGLETGPDGIWKTSYHLALKEDRELLDTVRLTQCLDEGDFLALKAAFPGNRSATEAVREVAIALDTAGPDEAKQSVDRAAEVMEKLHAEVQKAAAKKGRPILFCPQAPFVAEFHDIARGHLNALAAKVDELKREAGYQSQDAPITSDLIKRSDQCDKLIRLCEGACRVSRIAFVVLYTVWDGTEQDGALRQEFVALETVAERITQSLADHQSMSTPKCAGARSALGTFAASMRRRIETIQGH